MRKRMFVYAAIGCLLAIGVVAWGGTSRAGYESAPYTVVEKEKNIEIREYPDLVLAATSAKFEARGNDGSFMRLFRYISGDNQSESKIAMTTPVFMEAEGEGSPGQMGFVMPQEVAKAGAPTPKGSGVEIRKREGGRFAVVRFSGVMDAKVAQAEEAKLREWIAQRGLEAESTSERAGDDPPFTPGFLRRNEVLIRLKPSAEAAPAVAASEK